MLILPKPYASKTLGQKSNEDSEISLKSVDSKRSIPNNDFNVKCFCVYTLDLPPPATRERPPGCKTVFVGGLPENGTEQIIVEMFEQCGEIIAIRKSKKNFCHIRFTEEYMVDKALYLSGRWSVLYSVPTRHNAHDRIQCICISST